LAKSHGYAVAASRAGAASSERVADIDRDDGTVVCNAPFEQRNATVVATSSA